ncbi:MAG: ZmpA/ZmpB/ZmpC family metallo-endopeptidase-related protein, partial [Christensenellaceae bacterium]
MKKKNLVITILLVILSMCFTIGLTACSGGFNGGGTSTEKSFTINCATEMMAGERIEITITKSYDFDMYHKDYEWKIVGENTVGGSFEFETLDKNSNYTNKFFRATMPGKVKIQAINHTSGTLTSNIVEITVKANYINTVDELKAIANSDKCYTLGANIDLSSESNWMPIEGFTGTLTGGGYSLQNLTLKVKSSDNVGLFSELKGTVSDLKLEDVNITGSGSGNNVGAIAGKNSGTIQNCEVDGTINCEYASCVGGIVGYSNTKLYNNVNNASVTSNEKVGGVVGYIAINDSLEIKANINNGTVTGTNYIGGIAGIMESTRPSSRGTYTTTISNCENNGTVTATGDYAGGIAGQAVGLYQYYSYDDYYVYLEISDCENNGKVTGKDYVAGIYGYGGNYVRSVTACVNSVDIVGNNYVGGYIGYSANTSTLNMNNNSSITGKGYVGGIAGYTGNVQNCKNNGTITSLGTILEDGVNKYCVGGIAGYCTGATNCINNVDITVELAGRGVGGIAGSIYCSNAIENNTNSGKITALQSTCVGGVAGRVIFTGNLTVKSNKNEASVTGASYVGGIAGIMECTRPSNRGTYTTTISDCENNGTVTATGDYAGGIA